MMQCRLCGCKFDEKTVEPCECHCVFGGCNGANVRCPNCGYDMPLPPELRSKQESNSLFKRIRTSLKQQN